MINISLRMLGIAVGYGAVAGMVAGLTYVLMTRLQHFIWSFSDAHWYIFVMVLVGGILLALLRKNFDLDDLQSLITRAEDPRSLQWQKTLILAISAIIAVAFGGAIGPEAGLLAVVAELSLLVSAKLAKTQQEAQVIGQAGTAAVLAGVYGSPPAGAGYDDDSLSSSKAPGLIAGISGFLGFVIVVRLLGLDSHLLHLPLSPRGDLSTWVYAIPPAIFASALSIGYLWFNAKTTHGIQRLGAGWVQTLVGTLVLAALFTAWPILRFSGHHELEYVADLAQDSAWLMLGGLAVLKMVATALSLAAGWRGGEFFPLAFAGAAAGAMLLGLIPSMDAGTAIVAGLTAGATVAIRKPLVVMLIVVFMVEGTAIGPVLIAAAIGMLAVNISPIKPVASH